MVENKFTGMMIAVIMVILAVILIFQIVGGSANTMINATYELTDATSCEDNVGNQSEQLYYNTSSGNCHNISGEETGIYYEQDYDLPLENLFSSSGVVLIVFMASIFIFVIVLMLRKIRKD